MGAASNIEWTDATWTPIRARNRETGKVGWFCTHASAGCVNCYAEGLNRRLGTGVDFKAQNLGAVELFLDEKMLMAPLSWRKPRMVFVCSMTDLFGDFVTDEVIALIYGVMVAAVHLRRHTFQVLTKRSARARRLLTDQAFWGEVNAYASTEVMERVDPFDRRSDDARATLDDYGPDEPPPGIWLGASVEDQPNADERLTDLVMTPAAVRFVSYEPALGPVDFRPWLWASGGLADPTPYPMLGGPRRGEAIVPAERIDWIIYGDESGPRSRPADEDWARSTRDQCADSGTAFFLKQRKIGGKMVSLPTLDGAVHDARPTVGAA